MLTAFHWLKVGQQADADVHPAVAHREDPAVAGQDVAGLVADVEVALDPRLVVAGRLEVAADGHAQRVGAVAAGAEGPAEAGVGAVGHHDVAGPHLLGSPPSLSFTTGAADEAAVDHRRDRLGLLPQGGARLHGPLGHQVVEVVAGDDVAVGREVGVLGPAQLERAAEGDRPQAVEAVVLGQLVGQAHVLELAHRPGRQAVAARLLAGEALLLDEEDVVAGLGQPVGARRPGRAAADDQDVVVGHRHRATASSRS